MFNEDIDESEVRETCEIPPGEEDDEGNMMTMDEGAGCNNNN